MARAPAGLLLVLLLGLLAPAAGCGYRIGSPAPLGETVRVVVVSNQARLVRSQAYLQGAIAEALTQRLGWTVGPAGSARLELAIHEEIIDSTGSDERDIPLRWQVRVRGTALLASRHGPITRDFSGTGYASGIGDEPEALRAAARNAAASIAAWLDHASMDWNGRGAAPDAAAATPPAPPAPPR